MVARRADEPSARPRPRPGPGLTARLPDPARTVEPPAPESTTRSTTRSTSSGQSTPPSTRRSAGRGRRRKPGRQLARIDQPRESVVAAAGSAIVTAARVGRLLGRSGWRIAKQIPVVNAVEQQAQKLGQGAANEMRRLLEMPQSVFGSASPEEQRVMMLVQDADTDAEPLRTAMSELLDRSTEADTERSRDYLFGTIVSQLVPDEARILAALAGGRAFAAVDVVSKQVGRSSTRTVLANVSTVAAAASISLPGNGATYLSRLQGFGLLDFGPPTDELDSHFELLANDPAVRAARDAVENGKQGNAKIVRKTVSLSPLGREFWAACAPDRPSLSQDTG